MQYRTIRYNAVQVFENLLNCKKCRYDGNVEDVKIHDIDDENGLHVLYQSINQSTFYFIHKQKWYRKLYAFRALKLELKLYWFREWDLNKN